MRDLISILDVQRGDTIVERANGRITGKTEVKKIDTESCRHKVHINDRECWERASMVEVVSSTKSEDDLAGAFDFYKD